MADEKRLISVEKTVRELENEIYWTDSTKAAIRAFLRTVPAVDAVEVVRCKACKEWCRNSGITESPNGHCFCHDIETNGHDFCSYGERRGNV